MRAVGSRLAVMLLAAVLRADAGAKSYSSGGGFLDVLKDTTGLFEVTDDQSGVKETFSRLNGLLESYPAAVLGVAETTPDGKALPAKSSALKIEYWDSSREVALGGGKSAREFLFVEMNSDSGWCQLWRGREFFT